MKKILLLFCAVLVLSVPAFADGDAYFATDSISLTNSSTDVVTTFENNGSGVIYFYNQADEVGGSPVVRTIALSNDSSAVVRTSWSNTGYTETQTVNQSLTDGWYYRRLAYFGSNEITYDPALSVFPADTVPSDIVSALNGFLAPPIPPGRFTIPRGNVAYIQVPSSQTLNLTSTFMQYSNLVWVQYGPWGDTGQRVGTASSLPTSSTVFPLAGSSAITWSKKPPVDLLGRTKTGISTVSASPGQYLVIYNPTWSYLTENLRDGVGASILVEGTFSYVRVFPLSQELTISNAVDGLSSSSNDGYTSYYDATFTEDGTAEWTNQDGEVTQPVNGGQNMQSDPISAADLIDNIVGLLKKIVENIESVFTFGYEAIQQLAGLMSGFVSVFSSLYNWLPNEVHAALISAVSVAIMIGVFKVFL